MPLDKVWGAGSRRTLTLPAVLSLSLGRREG